MKVQIVNYEQGQNNGILTKFAVKLNDELLKLKISSKIQQFPDYNADVNHHINYLPYKYHANDKSLNTLMVTHIFDGYKFDALKEGMKTADCGICMSNQTRKDLTAKGIKNLKTVLPAHNGHTRRHKVIAILTNVYPDGCKREGMLKELCKTISKDDFAFIIMGSGWQEIAVDLTAEGFQIQYLPEFVSEANKKILEIADYALYFGMDEGSMGILDAIQANVKTIGTPQGFHLDSGLDYYFTTQKQLNKIFAQLKPVDRINDWTWEKYAKEHLKIWKNLLK